MITEATDLYQLEIEEIAPPYGKCLGCLKHCGEYVEK
jgi:hypothetical protein